MSELTEKLKGRFIVIDGPDGAGKSTQVRMLAEFLRGQGLAVTETRDPGGTPIGDKIRHILLDNGHAEMTVGCETMLYMASRAQLLGEVIAPAIERQECVISDRWVSSTIAYQVAGGAEPAGIIAAYSAALGNFRPDLTVILDLPADVGLARAGRAEGPDRMESKGLEFHNRVRELFLDQAGKNKTFAVVDAGGAVEQVQDRLRETIERHGW